MPNQQIYQDYLKYWQAKEKEWEGLCAYCGGCCGAYDDPCRYLQKAKDGSYYCQIYPQRLGTRKSQNGERFDCVPVKEILHTHWKNDYLCSYKQYLKIPWRKDETRA